MKRYEHPAITVRRRISTLSSFGGVTCGLGVGWAFDQKWIAVALAAVVFIAISYFQYEDEQRVDRTLRMTPR